MNAIFRKVHQMVLDTVRTTRTKKTSSHAEKNGAQLQPAHNLNMDVETDTKFSLPEQVQVCERSEHTINLESSEPANDRSETNRKKKSQRKKSSSKRSSSKGRRKSSSSSSSSESSSSSDDERAKNSVESSSSSDEDDSRDSIVVLDRPKKSHKSKSKRSSEKKRSHKQTSFAVPMNASSIPLSAGFLPIDVESYDSQQFLLATRSSAALQVTSFENENTSIVEVPAPALPPRPRFERPAMLELSDTAKSLGAVVLLSDKDSFVEQFQRTSRRPHERSSSKTSKREHRLSDAGELHLQRSSQSSVPDSSEQCYERGSLILRFEMNGSKTLIGDGVQNPFANGASGQFFFGLDGIASTIQFQMLRLKTLTLTLAPGEYGKLRSHRSFLVWFFVSTFRDSSHMNEGNSELLFNYVGPGMSRREVNMFSCRTVSPDERLLRRFDCYATIPNDVEAVGGMALLSQQNFMHCDLHFTRPTAFGSLVTEQNSRILSREQMYLVASMFNSETGVPLRVAPGTKCKMTLEVDS